MLAYSATCAIQASEHGEQLLNKIYVHSKAITPSPGALINAMNFAKRLQKSLGDRKVSSIARPGQRVSDRVMITRFSHLFKQMFPIFSAQEMEPI